MSTEYLVKIKSPSVDILPKGWLKVPFEYMAENISVHIEPGETDLDVYVGLEHLDSDSLRIKRWGTPDDVIGIKLHVWPGDIIFGKRRAYQRKVAVADFEGICSAHAMVLRAKPENIVPEFLPFFMQSEEFAQRAIAISEGSLSPTIKWKTLAQQEFIIPPKGEQRRIADMLWAAEECIVKNEKLVEKAEFYNKTLMMELFTKGIGHREFKDTEIGRIPEEWEVVRLEELAETITKGTTPTTYGYNFIELGINFIKIESIDKCGNFIFGNIAHISEEANNALSRSILRENDILFSIAGALGRVAVVTKEILPANTNQAIAIIRIKRDSRSTVEYLRYYLMNPLIQNYITTIAVQTAQANLSLTQISNFLICIPPLTEQRRIFEILFKVEDTIKKAQENIKKTRALKMMLINQFLKNGLENTYANPQQGKKIIYETQVSE